MEEIRLKLETSVGFWALKRIEPKPYSESPFVLHVAFVGLLGVVLHATRFELSMQGSWSVAVAGGWSTVTQQQRWLK